MTSVMVISRYFCGVSPALRTIRIALAMCLPFSVASISGADASSIHLVKLMSCTLALPAPPPPPAWKVPDCDMPHDQASTSIFFA